MARPDTLQAWVRSLERFGERPAVTWFTPEGCQQLTFLELSAHVRKLSGGLRRDGLRKGQRVVLYAPASISWITACLAVIDAGAVLVPLDSQMRGEELAHVLDDTAAQLVLTDENGRRRLEESDLHERRRVLLLKPVASNGKRLSDTAAEGHDAILPGARPREVAVIFYTSGTTGSPKGVPLTHGNLLANLETLLELRLVAVGDRLLEPLPLHHVYPFTVGFLAPLSAGASIVLPMSLTGPQIVRTLREARATGIVSVPRFYAALYDGIEAQLEKQGRIVVSSFRVLLAISKFLCRRCGISAGRWLFSRLRDRVAPALRFVAAGGAALDAELAWKLEGLGWSVASGYGLTETSPILTFNLPGEGIGSAGKPLPGVDVRIAEPREGQTHGEVQAKGSNVFSGYLNLEEETHAAFTDDGYFRTGDLGYFENDRLKLTGRASTMIVLPGGENVEPDRVEDALSKGRHIGEAAVLTKGGKLVALIVPKTTGSDHDRVSEHVAGDLRATSQVLPSHHRIADYALTREPLPRTRLGKLRRHELESLFDEAKQQERTGWGVSTGAISIERMSAEDRELLEDRTARTVWAWLAKRFPDARLAPDTSFGAELGVDSMEWLNLSLDIREVAGVDLSNEAIGRIETVRDLLREAAEAQGALGTSKDLFERLAEPEALLDEEQIRWLESPGLAARLFGKLLVAMNRIVLRSLFGLTVRGCEHLPERPCVLTPNHQSYLDAPAIAAALPATRLERTYWGAWTGVMFKNTLMRAVSRATRVVPIDVERNALSGLALAVCVLRQGSTLVWFPEGAISEDGELQPFQPGLGFVLVTESVPVVPVRVQGTRESLPRERWLPRRRRISVTFGEPFDAGRFLASRGREGHRELIDAVRERVAAL